MSSAFTTRFGPTDADRTPETYKRRNVVERAFGRLKQWRGIATRYDQHARNYRAGIILGAIVLFWLR